MSDVQIRPVQTGREKRQFLKVPWAIYRDDPHWVPRLIDSEKELVGYKAHPFHDDAEVQTFLALRRGKPCGRLAAIVNHAHNRRYNEKLGFIGFFESIDDSEVAAGLLDAARQWLASRGMQAMRGPANPSLNYECGLLIDGKDSPPVFMMPYNPRYYGRLWEDYGFEKVQDVYAYWGHMEMIESLDDKLAFVTREIRQRFDIKLRCLDRSRFVEDVRLFMDIYNQSLVGTWGFVPLSAGELDHIARSLRHLIIPELTCAAEADGQTIGATFALLDYNPRIKAIGGRLFPFGFIRLLWNRRAIKRVRIISTNVLPQYQRWGVGLLLMAGLLPNMIQWGVTEGEFSWVLESNRLSWGSLERGGAVRYKSYRMYDFPFAV